MQYYLVSLFLLLPISIFGQSTLVGGFITNDTFWSPGLGTIMVVSNVVVTNKAMLTIEAGTVVKLTNGVSISAVGGSAIDIEGTASAPVSLSPMVGNNTWGTINA